MRHCDAYDFNHVSDLSIEGATVTFNSLYGEINIVDNTGEGGISITGGSTLNLTGENTGGEGFLVGNIDVGDGTTANTINADLLTVAVRDRAMVNDYGHFNTGVNCNTIIGGDIRNLMGGDNLDVAPDGLATTFTVGITPDIVSWDHTSQSWIGTNTTIVLNTPPTKTTAGQVTVTYLKNGVGSTTHDPTDYQTIASVNVDPTSGAVTMTAISTTRWSTLTGSFISVPAPYMPIVDFANGGYCPSHS